MYPPGPPQQPQYPMQPQVSHLAPSRKDTIMIFTILGWAACGIFSFIAYFMAKEDLSQMYMGNMDDRDMSSVNTMKIISAVHIGLMLVGILCFCGIFAMSGFGSMGRGY